MAWDDPLDFKKEGITLDYKTAGVDIDANLNRYSVDSIRLIYVCDYLCLYLWGLRGPSIEKNAMGRNITQLNRTRVFIFCPIHSVKSLSICLCR